MKPPRYKGGRRKKPLRARRLSLFPLSSAIALLFMVVYFQRIGPGSPAGPRALIVDGLLHHPNQRFIDEASGILAEAGFEVDVVGAGEVTVEFYRLLPSKGYRLIILRVHAGPLFRHLPGGGKIAEGTILFTTEAYDERRYVDLQASGLLAVGRIYGRPEAYFAVPSWFFEEASTGWFEGSTIILESCYGFYWEAPYSMAEAFLYKGADAFIGWDGEVQAEHADRAVVELLRALLIEGLTIEEAVDRVMRHVGPDPYYRSTMLYHPPEAAPMRLRPMKADSQPFPSVLNGNSAEASETSFH